MMGVTPEFRAIDGAARDIAGAVAPDGRLVEPAAVADRAAVIEGSEPAYLDGLDAACLKLGISETVATGDMNRTMDALVGLKRLGVGLVIDHFGTGYSGPAAPRRCGAARSTPSRSTAPVSSVSAPTTATGSRPSSSSPRCWGYV